MKFLRRFRVSTVLTVVMGISIDITERQNIKEELAESKRKFEQILKFLPDPTFAIDLEGRVIYWNRAMEELIGVPASDVIGKGDHEYSYRIYGHRKGMLIDLVFRPDGDLWKVYDYVRVEGDSVYAEVKASIANGSIAYLWGKASPLYDNAGNIVGAMESIRDISMMKENEERLRESESKFRSIFEAMPLGFFRVSPDDEIIEANPAGLHMFGFSSREEMNDFLQRDAKTIFLDPDEWSRFSVMLVNAEGGTLQHSSKNRKKDGTVFSSSITARMVYDVEKTPLYIEGLIEDISERELLQEMMVQSEKMVTVAGLAAGMAHEINNPLGIIMQLSENAERRLLSGLASNIEAAGKVGITMEQIATYVSSRQVDTYLKGIREAGSRAAKIVSNMLQFSRRSSEEKALHDLRTLIDKTVDLASNDYDLKKKYDFRQIDIIREYTDIPEVFCSEIQMEQVFLNLFKNAAYAMMEKKYPAGEKPTIRISVVSESDYVAVTVDDNGPGMDEEVQKKIFEPFFTTKSPGLGTGLGLSVSYYIIVNGHAGKISVSSVKNNGTSFTIHIPKGA